jgi:hypothetical protein
MSRGRRTNSELGLKYVLGDKYHILKQMIDDADAHNEKPPTVRISHRIDKSLPTTIGYIRLYRKEQGKS